MPLSLSLSHIFFALQGTTVPPSGVHLGASWTIEDDDFPICSPLFEGAVARARVELLSSHGSISVKLHMESKEKLQSYCVDLRLEHILIFTHMPRLFQVIFFKSL